jgi:hypothetical protein
MDIETDRVMRTQTAESLMLSRLSILAPEIGP